MPTSNSSSNWRFKIGMSLVILSFISPIGALIVSYTKLSIELKLTLSGLFLAGIPELFLFAAVAILGKDGFLRIKTKLLKFLRRFKPANEVSRCRYYFGLTMFLIPLLYGWLIMYIPFEKYPNFLAYRTWISLISDICFLLSFLVLGGNFWDKIRALFFYKATAQFEDKK